MCNSVGISSSMWLCLVCGFLLGGFVDFGFLADWLGLLVFVVFLGDALLCGVGII